MSKAVAVQLLFGGRVQGVSFRDFAKRQAEIFNVAGYVKNGADGMVQVVAEGQRPDLLHFIEVLMSGPPQANVSSVETKWLEPSGVYTDFKINY